MNLSETAGNTETGNSAFFNEEKKLSISSKKPSQGSELSVTEVQLTTHIA